MFVEAAMHAHDTEPHDFERVAAPATFRSFAATEQGPRHRNEDAHVHDPARGIFVVCDGMGRHAGGDVASRLAATTCARALAARGTAFDGLMVEDSPAMRARALQAMRESVVEASEAVYLAARADPGLRDMGTTLDALVVRGRHVVIGHVGDGRTYLFRAHQLFPLTEDHTLVAAQLKAGTITAEEAARSPFKHVLARAIGPSQAVEVDAGIVECAPGDLVLTCTDGLHVPIADKLPVLLRERPDAIAGSLLAAARDAGTTDNATCIVLHIPGAPESEADRLVTGKVDALRAVALFDEFTYREKQAVLACATAERRERGEIIVRDGEVSNALYVVVRGSVSVEAKGARVATLEAGSHFGEMGLVDEAPRSATVRAATSTDLLRLSREALWTLMRREPELGTKFSWALAQALCQRLRSTNESFALVTSSGGYRIG